MNSNSTQENLLLYLYNETWMADSVIIQHAIDSDPEIEEEFENLKLVCSLLDGIKISPSSKSIKKIMEFA